MTFVRGGQGQLGLMFAGFSQFWRMVRLYLWMALCVVAWLLLLIIPGIIASYAYAMAFYIAADNPSLNARETLWRSKELMKGHKGRLFCLYLRFFGWQLLCLLTCGIGFLWLVPYMNTSVARFYDDLRPSLAGQPALVPAPAPVPAGEFPPPEQNA
jgi:uncharacterized membrane protein